MTEMFWVLACCLVNLPKLADFSEVLKVSVLGEETLGLELALEVGVEGIVLLFADISELLDKDGSSIVSSADAKLSSWGSDSAES